MMHVNQVHIQMPDEVEESTFENDINQHVREMDSVDLWEEYLSEWTIRDIREDVFEAYMNRVRAAGRLCSDISDGKAADTKSEGGKTVPDKLFLMKGRTFKKAGAVLFCDTNYCDLQMAVFAGYEKDEPIDVLRCCGPVFELVKAGEEYILAHQKLYHPIVSEADSDNFFQKVIREALMNAFSHRDFSTRQSNEVLIFDNRLEIYNPGGFPDGYEPDDFINGRQRPVKRNPLIVSALYYSGDVNGLGAGIRCMQRNCEKAGIELSFRQEKAGTVVVLTAPKVGQRVVTDEGQMMSGCVDLSPKELIVADYLHSHENVTNADVRELVHVGTTAARNLLNRLVEKGILTASGEHRGRKYRLNIEKH